MPASTEDAFQMAFDARLVESFRGDWSRCSDIFHDPEVARDFVTHLRPTHGPTVVRAVVRGGTKQEQKMVSGDWFCDDVGDAYGNNTFRTHPEAIVETWEERLSASQMMNFAHSHRIQDERFVIAACACARECLPMVAMHRAKVSEALDVAEAWVSGVGRDVASLTRAQKLMRDEVEAVSNFVTRTSRQPARSIRALAPEEYAIHALSDAVSAAAAWGVDPASRVREICDNVVEGAEKAVADPRDRRESAKRAEALCAAIRSRISTLMLLRAQRDAATQLAVAMARSEAGGPRR